MDHSCASRSSRVHSGSHGFNQSGLRIERFIQIQARSIGLSYVVLDLSSIAWDHWARLGVLGFIRVRVGLLGRTSESSGLCGFTEFHRDGTRCGKVHSVSRRFTCAGRRVH